MACSSSRQYHICKYGVLIPWENRTGTVTLQEASLTNLLLNEAKLKSEVQKKVEQTDSGKKIKIGSGTYRFSYPAGVLKS